MSSRLVWTGLLVALWPAAWANAQQCPPRAGAPADWCRRIDRRGLPLPAVPTPPLAPDQAQMGTGFVSPYPPTGGGAMPAMPQTASVPLSAMPFPPGQFYQSVCLIDNQGTGCTVTFGAPIPSGMPCYCGQYPGITP